MWQKFWPSIVPYLLAAVILIPALLLSISHLIRYFKKKPHDLLYQVGILLEVYVPSALGIAVALYALFNKDKRTGLILGLVANIVLLIRHDQSKREQFNKDVAQLAGNKSAIQTFERWDAETIRSIIKQARHSIEIVDSHFDEAPALSALVHQAFSDGATRLDISVYMLDPGVPFGALRFLEKEKNRQGKTAHQFRDQYRRAFLEDCKRINEAFLEFEEEGKIGLKIYAYPTMPTIRLIIVDELEYVFGWFPLHALNPAHPCCVLSAPCVTDADRCLLASLRRQFAEIKADSREFEPAEVDGQD